jgi:membrane-associated protein
VTRLLLAFAFALAESGLGLGAVVPGEVAISGLAASVDGLVPTLALGVAVMLGAVAGDHLGLTVGRLGGGRLRESRLIARIGVDRWDRAADLVQRHGFWAVLASRMLPFVRTVMPVVAGAAELRYRSFLAASVIGGAGWAAVWVGAGAGLGATGILGHPWLLGGAALVFVTAVAGRALVRRNRSRAAARPLPVAARPSVMCP